MCLFACFLFRVETETEVDVKEILCNRLWRWKIRTSNQEIWVERKESDSFPESAEGTQQC